jgi:D-beta-D-heptose 7-phosphate kinase/D-beta-D-heptose 1-phosphate adenosyltransferase
MSGHGRCIEEMLMDIPPIPINIDPKRIDLDNFTEDNLTNYICIIGDIMLDKYEHVDLVNISAEAPVMVVKHQRFSYAAGGAANVAMNCMSLGAAPYLVGIMGEDENAGVIRNILKSRSISATNILACRDYVTTEKRRVVSPNFDQLIRIDREDSQHEINIGHHKRFSENLEVLSHVCNCLVISDYNKGMAQLYGTAIAWFKKHSKLIIANIKPKNIEMCADVDLIILNKEEYRECEMQGSTISTNYLVTHGSDGMWFYGKDKSTLYIPPSPTTAVDVCGAGDTVVASIAVSGKFDKEALTLAAKNAASVVGRYGTCTP